MWHPLSEDRIAFWLEWVSSEHGGESWIKNSGLLSEYMKLCKSGLLDLAVFEPSAGADLSFLCRGVSVEYVRPFDRRE